MNFRIIILGIIWIGIMVLLFATPSESQTFYFNWLPSRAIVNGFLFWGFVHIWIVSFRKQLKNDFLKRGAFPIVFVAALIIALLSEIFIYLSGNATSINYWNLLFDFIGSCFGLISYQLVYDTNN